MGNICRSPTAEGVFRKLVAASPLAGQVDIQSAGTLGYHAGSKPDPRAIALAAGRGYDLDSLRARQVTAADFDNFDYLVTMDRQNMADLKEVCPPGMEHKIRSLLSFSGDEAGEVPDPYYGSARDFEHALALIERGCRGLLKHLGERRFA